MACIYNMLRLKQLLFHTTFVVGVVKILKYFYRNISCSGAG